MKPEICIHCLGCYNDGQLVFKWLDIMQLSPIEEEIINFMKQAHHTGTNHEEHMIADYSDFPNMGEYPDIEELQEVINEMQENPDKVEAIKIFIENGDNIENFEESYMGEYKDMIDFVEEYAHEIFTIPAELLPYFDYEKLARDLEIGGDFWETGGHVFRNI